MSKVDLHELVQHLVTAVTKDMLECFKELGSVDCSLSKRRTLFACLRKQRKRIARLCVLLKWIKNGSKDQESLKRIREILETSKTAFRDAIEGTIDIFEELDFSSCPHWNVLESLHLLSHRTYKLFPQSIVELERTLDVSMKSSTRLRIELLKLHIPTDIQIVELNNDFVLLEVTHEFSFKLSLSSSERHPLILRDLRFLAFSIPMRLRSNLVSQVNSALIGGPQDLSSVLGQLRDFGGRMILQQLIDGISGLRDAGYSLEYEIEISKRLIISYWPKAPSIPLEGQLSETSLDCRTCFEITLDSGNLAIFHYPPWKHLVDTLEDSKLRQNMKNPYFLLKNGISQAFNVVTSLCANARLFDFYRYLKHHREKYFWISLSYGNVKGNEAKFSSKEIAFQLYRDITLSLRIAKHSGRFCFFLSHSSFSLTDKNLEREVSASPFRIFNCISSVKRKIVISHVSSVALQHGIKSLYDVAFHYPRGCREAIVFYLHLVEMPDFYIGLSVDRFANAKFSLIYTARDSKQINAHNISPLDVGSIFGTEHVNGSKTFTIAGDRLLSHCHVESFENIVKLAYKDAVLLSLRIHLQGMQVPVTFSCSEFLIARPLVSTMDPKHSTAELVIKADLRKYGSWRVELMCLYAYLSPLFNQLQDEAFASTNPCYNKQEDVVVFQYKSSDLSTVTKFAAELRNFFRMASIACELDSMNKGERASPFPQNFFQVSLLSHCTLKLIYSIPSQPATASRPGDTIPLAKAEFAIHIDENGSPRCVSHPLKYPQLYFFDKVVSISLRRGTLQVLKEIYRSHKFVSQWTYFFNSATRYSERACIPLKLDWTTNSSSRFNLIYRKSNSDFFSTTFKISADDSFLQEIVPETVQPWDKAYSLIRQWYANCGYHKIHKSDKELEKISELQTNDIAMVEENRMYQLKFNANCALNERNRKVLEHFYNASVNAAPYSYQRMKSFFRMINAPLHVLDALIPLFEREIAVKQSGLEMLLCTSLESPFEWKYSENAQSIYIVIQLKENSIAKSAKVKRIGTFSIRLPIRYNFSSLVLEIRTLQDTWSRISEGISLIEGVEILCSKSLGQICALFSRSTR